MKYTNIIPILKIVLLLEVPSIDCRSGGLFASTVLKRSKNCDPSGRKGQRTTSVVEKTKKKNTHTKCEQEVVQITIKQLEMIKPDFLSLLTLMRLHIFI